MADRVLVTIGTRKGVFVAEAAKTRRRFDLRGPFGDGVPVYATLIDTRGATPRLFASSCNPFFGNKLLRSTDLGTTFKETKSTPAFPKDDGRALANIWSLEPGPGKRDLLCGVEPASLFRSRDYQSGKIGTDVVQGAIETRKSYLALNDVTTRGMCVSKLGKVVTDRRGRLAGMMVFARRDSGQFPLMDELTATHPFYISADLNLPQWEPAQCPLCTAQEPLWQWSRLPEL